VFTRLFKEYGLPKRIRTDNGVPFATNTLARLSKLSAWWVRLGVLPELIEPGKPQQNGRHERMHRTLKDETTRPASASLPAQQRRFNTFRTEFNNERPHEALDQQTPASLSLEEIRLMEARIDALERELAVMARQSEACQALASVPGIGLLTSTAMVAAVGDPRSFDSGRRYASFFGLTPREHSSGDRRYLGRISKRGNRYVRTLLTHGARSVLRAATVARRAGRKLDRLRSWALELQARSNHNKATCALANKLARIAWAVWVKHERYEAAAA
jgi:transposase